MTLQNLVEELHRLNDKTCARKVQAHRSCYVPKDREKCLNGCPNSPECPDYVAIRKTHQRYRHIRLYGGNKND